MSHCLSLKTVLLLTRWAPSIPDARNFPPHYFHRWGACSQCLQELWKAPTNAWWNVNVFTPPSVSFPFFFRSGRVGKQSRQGTASTNNQGSVQRSAIHQILNCLYNPHLSPHGCFNPSNGFFMDAPTFLELKTKPQTNTNETAIVKTGFQKWHPLPDYKKHTPLG